MGRSIVAVVLGIILGGIVVGLVEYVGHMIYPMPAGIDTSNPESLKTYAANAPTGAKLFVILAWALGSLTGGWLAAFVARQSHTQLALIVGGVLMIFGIMNMLTIPSPLWFWIAGILVFLPAAYAGARLVRLPQVV